MGRGEGALQKIVNAERILQKLLRFAKILIVMAFSA
jgi:hypothetical protein